MAVENVTDRGHAVAAELSASVFVQNKDDADHVKREKVRVQQYGAADPRRAGTSAHQLGAFDSVSDLKRSIGDDIASHAGDHRGGVNIMSVLAKTMGNVAKNDELMQFAGTKQVQVKNSELSRDNQNLTVLQGQIDKTVHKLENPPHPSGWQMFVGIFVGIVLGVVLGALTDGLGDIATEALSEGIEGGTEGLDSGLSEGLDNADLAPDDLNMGEGDNIPMDDMGSGDEAPDVDNEGGEPDVNEPNNDETDDTSGEDRAKAKEDEKKSIRDQIKQGLKTRQNLAKALRFMGKSWVKGIITAGTMGAGTALGQHYASADQAKANGQTSAAQGQMTQYQTTSQIIMNQLQKAENAIQDMYQRMVLSPQQQEQMAESILSNSINQWSQTHI